MVGVTTLRFSNFGDVQAQHGDNDGGGASPANEAGRRGVKEVHNMEGYTCVPKWRRIVLEIGVYQRCNLAVAGDVVASSCSQGAREGL